MKYLNGVQRVENELTVAPADTISEKHLEEEIKGLFRQTAWPVSPLASNRVWFT